MDPLSDRLPETRTTGRTSGLDSLRGVAVVWMVAFHFAFDLNHYGFIRQDFLRDPVWTLQRVAIVSLFLFCAGMGQALALQREPSWSRFWRRWAQVAAAALLVTLGSWLMFPRSAIWFGVLHGIAVMLIVVRLSARWGAALWLLGLVAVLLPWLWRSPVFDSVWLMWTGLAVRRPVTEDFVPLLPWLGLMWWGAAAGASMQRRWPMLLTVTARTHAPSVLTRALRPLAMLGRHSLLIYLAHQPILIGLVASAAAWRSGRPLFTGIFG